MELYGYIELITKGGCRLLLIKNGTLDTNNAGLVLAKNAAQYSLARKRSRVTILVEISHKITEKDLYSKIFTALSSPSNHFQSMEKNHASSSAQKMKNSLIRELKHHIQK